ncbi:hypothetical protein WDU94_008602, partial [Cyamophila willieti]
GLWDEHSPYQSDHTHVYDKDHTTSGPSIKALACKGFRDSRSSHFHSIEFISSKFNKTKLFKMGQERIIMDVVALNGKEKTTMDIVALGKEKTSMDIVALGKEKTSMNIVALGKEKTNMNIVALGKEKTSMNIVVV